MKVITVVTSLTLIATIQAAPSCQPTNKAYTWFSGGDTWFTLLSKKLDWKQAAVECRKIQPGSSDLASIESNEEQSSIAKSSTIPFSQVWTAGILMNWNASIHNDTVFAPPKWYWSKNDGKGSTLKEITDFHWETNPYQPSGDGSCQTILQAPWHRNWNDLPCDSKIPALCEVRCSRC